MVNDKIVNVFIDDQLVGKAKPFINPSLSSGAASPLSEASPLYFLTIQSDAIGGTLRFVTEDGQELTIVNDEQMSEIEPSSLQGGVGGRLFYVPDSHLGSLESPVILTPFLSEEGRGEVSPYKLLEDDHVVIIRNGEKYDVTDKKLR